MLRYHVFTARGIAHTALLIFLLLQSVHAYLHFGWDGRARAPKISSDLSTRISGKYEAPLTYCNHPKVVPHEYSVHLHRDYTVEQHKQAVKHDVDLESAFTWAPFGSPPMYYAELSDSALNAVRRDIGVDFVHCVFEDEIDERDSMPCSAGFSLCEVFMPGYYRAPLVDCDGETHIPNEYHVHLHCGSSLEEHKHDISHRANLDCAMKSFTGPTKFSGPKYLAKLSKSALGVVRGDVSVAIVYCNTESVSTSTAMKCEPTAHKFKEMILLSQGTELGIREE